MELAQVIYSPMQYFERRTSGILFPLVCRSGMLLAAFQELYNCNPTGRQPVPNE